MKRIVTVQDVSCVGRCSLTVALPIISAMGVETAVLPTAVLSTHTMFKNFTFRDLTSDIAPIAAHWKQENIKFDGIYTGYLGSFEQINLVKKLIDDFSTSDNFVFIDPVMADNGKLYPGFAPDFPKAMAELCGKADIIVPNMTEATLMLDKPYPQPGTYDRDYVRNLLRELATLGARFSVLTGCTCEPGKLGVMGYDAQKDEFFEYYHKRYDVSFHGTGDVFSSTAVGALARGVALPDAFQLAADFTARCIYVTMEDPDKVWYGVSFESAFPELIQMVQSKVQK